MNTISYKTVSANKQTAEKNWVLVDAEGQTLGRLASKVAYMLRGKHKPNFTPHVDCGDNVVVINAGSVKLSGSKEESKEYITHTGFPGGQRFSTPKELLQKQPIKIVENAVKGMLPKNRLGRELFRNLHVYEGAEHKQEAQKPKTIDLNTIIK
ncbi:MAG TPA: 50S ribosomal protein L13 [Cryomorphaceae bacterium]|nr:50S ribosomal protein L13 [Owenweeksia sp.]MBF99846.1 50S ribosomal protein L13 [Owenweeksia sp.]HAD97141.1 50S ribosomal protein L13 [Cryomorphaceae bacterium]HBF20865.1 50S ribosomal protein L13 [Cryomorphaceae bacterium]